MSLCIVPGCTNTAFVDRNGRVYQKCNDHMRKSFSVSSKERHVRSQAALQQTGQTVEILVVDWKDERILHVTGTVTCVEPLVKTEADLLDIMARAAQSGKYIAKPHAFKLTNLKPAAPEKKKGNA